MQKGECLREARVNAVIAVGIGKGVQDHDGLTGFGDGRQL
ncbi:hypothetical protein SAMN03097708_02069 [Thiohalomonas denitrificans]|uniref:Uncharacterized protein n=1 Tax=Thiohalomonas denitrificans TaxID=415747 RepID=A0A1G5QI34_9GAMM|nr:hypothetical protein SAMN03097708_02069 [Thiohalomonas denitrificans]